MNQHSIVFRAGLVLALAYTAVAAAQGDLEVTMRVLDDVSDVDAVIIAIGNDDAAVVEPTNRGGDDAPAETPAADSGVPAAEAAAADELVPDNEDDSEGGIEDRDVVEDPVEVEPAI